VKVEIKIDEDCAETWVGIHTNAMTDDIIELARKISEYKPATLAGFRGERVVMLNPADILRFYSANQRVYGVTKDEEYTVRLRLYELENQLPPDFVRISNSEIINLKWVASFDLSFVGTVWVKFKNGSDTYVSRRYVPKIKQKLGI